MKKATVGLIGTFLVLMLSSNAWAQPGIRVDLGGNGFGFAISDGRSSFSTFGYGYYQPYPYYSGIYPNRPYLGWGGFRGYQHNHKHWNQHRSSHHHKGHFSNHQPRYKRGGHGQHYRNHDQRGHDRRQGRR